MTDKNSVEFVAVGDVGPLRENPGELFDLTRSILKTADIAFGQLEKSISDRGMRQLQLPRGLARTSPATARALSEAGFRVMSFASNHTLDFSDEALLDTIEHLGKYGVKVIGAGTNIQEARKPAIFDIKGTRIGFLAYCSVVPRGFEAWKDKPGLAPVRATTSYEQVDWQPGAPPKVLTKADPDDLAAMVDDIKRLRPDVDVLVVSQHWGVHHVPSLVAMYQHEIGHAAIDAGADIIVGHHAHILKGIEVYKGKVIFFSLCNFGMDHPVTHQKTQGGSYGLYEWEMDPEIPSYGFSIDAQKTIMVKCTVSEKKITRVAFLPLWVNKKGQPEPLPRSDPRSDKVYEYMKWACQDQKLDTKFARDGDEVVVLT
jgi:poly-gamma-glutamate capsule biosynthesis protein CapA/YwtB (metallophosphatase superfamily)